MYQRIGYVLDSRWLWLGARILLAVILLSSGLVKLVDFQGEMAEMRVACLQLEWFLRITMGILLISGAALVMLDKPLWMGAVALVGVLLLTILILERLWSLDEPQLEQAMYRIMENISLVGSLLAVAIASRCRSRLQVALELYCGTSSR